jgi:H+/Cl- antiporter ClcA
MTGVIQYRGIYSVIGAAAMTGCVTRTVSVAVIVLEVNGHMSHLLPVMMTVVASFMVSEWLRPISFFEQLYILRGLG